MEKVRRCCGFLNGIDVSAMGSRGGLCLTWNDEVQVTLEVYSLNSITMVIKGPTNGVDWQLMGFYGSPYASQREDTWEELRRLRDGVSILWCVCGDINEVLYAREKKRGIPRCERRMKSF